MLREAARIEAAHGAQGRALDLYEAAIDTFHRSGNVSELAIALGNLVTFLARNQRTEVAAALYGAITQFAPTAPSIRTGGLDALRAALGERRVEQLAAAGAAMDPAEAVRYARDQIRLARDELAITSGDAERP
jgi:hypothetical protein